MHVILTGGRDGTSQFYDEDLMGDHYDPPGPTFRQDDDGRRIADLQKPVAQNLIDAGIADPLDDAGDSSATDDDAESDEGDDGESDDTDDSDASGESE